MGKHAWTRKGGRKSVTVEPEWPAWGCVKPGSWRARARACAVQKAAPQFKEPGENFWTQFK